MQLWEKQLNKIYSLWVAIFKTERLGRNNGNFKNVAKYAQ